MWECKYARETVDYRLTFLRLLKKIWLLPLSAVLGALLIGSIYYMSRMCFGNGRTYQTETLFYIKYLGSNESEEYLYINQYTWGEILTTDFFVDSIIADTNGEFTKEEILDSTYAGVESDVRYLYTRCTTRSPERSELLDKALEKAVVAYGVNQKEFYEITPVRKETKDVSNIRLGTACILGASGGLFICIVIWLVSAITDTSVYLPSTLERRYKRRALGAPSMPEFAVNCKLLLSEKPGVWVVPGDGETSIEGLDLSVNYLPCDNPIAKPETAGLLKDASCVIVAVRAGAHNGKRLERTLEELTRLGAIVSAFVLVDEDKKLIERYYRK